MFFHPLMKDIESLSEKDIIEKMGKVQQRLGTAARFGMNQQIIDQLRMTMLAYQAELISRSEKVEQLGDRGCAWDMDKYVEENRNEKVEEQDDTPRWQSFTYDERGSDSDEQWNPNFDD